MSQLRWKCLSGSALKVIALLSMTVDHLSKCVWAKGDFFNEHLFRFAGGWVTPGFFLLTFGRLAFPIFAFLLIEGFYHTRSRTKYALRLGLLALISELPFDLCMTGNWFVPEKQNVFFTLLLGLLALWFIDLHKEDRLKQGLCLAGLIVISILLHADYGPAGLLLIILMSLIKDDYVLQAFAAGTLLPTHYRTGLLASIPISMYNGNRGFIIGKWLKYIFYLYYPVHLLIIWLISH